MEEMVQGLVGAIPQLLMMALSGAIGWLGGKLKEARASRREQEEQETRERDQTRAMLRWVFDFQLRSFYERYVTNREQITSAEKREIEIIYGYYHDTLGGNGEGTRKYNALMSLDTE